MSFNHSKTSNKDVNSLNKLYARFAAQWHSTVVRLGYMDAYRLLIQHYQKKKLNVANHVLDVGTGTGAFAMSYMELNPEIKLLSLLDSSPEMLKEASSNLVDATCEVNVIEGLLGTKKIDVSSIDTLLCAHVIEHTLNPLNSLKWFHYVLQPNGVILLSVSKPHWCTSLVRWRWGHRAFLPDEVCGMLVDAGFVDIEKITYHSGPSSRMSCGFYARKASS